MTRSKRRWPRATPPPLDPKDVKAVVRHRDGYRCTECGLTALEHIERYGRTLDVHRIVPGSAYTISGCQTLCVDCHLTKPRSPNRSAAGPRRLTVPDHLVPQLRDCARVQLRSLTSVVNVALREYFASIGRWPPPPP
jgi:5-methylcytosine-specific restriction endonuclease McrA